MSALNNTNVANKLEANLANKMATGYVDHEAQLLGKQGAHHNPLDRNFDGKVDFRDLKSNNNATFAHNPLDKNFDGKVDYKDFAGQSSSFSQTSTFQQTNVLNQGAYIQGTKRASLVRAQPTIVETIQKDIVIQERIHPVQKEEIQPIIYREREQLDVKQVTQMLHETQIHPTIIQQRELPAQRREAVVERGAAITENFVAASREVDAVTRTQVVHAPIVQEVIKKTIIEEIQPVLERDIIQSTVIQNTQPIYEKIVEAPTVLRSTTIVQDRGFIGGDLAALEAQGFNLGAAGKRLSANYSQTTFTSTSTMAHNPLDRNFDGKVDYKDFAGQPSMLGQNMSAPLAGENLLTSHGLKRRSLVEALPQSYSYLNNGLGNNLDSKIVQQEMLAGNAMSNSALPSKSVL